MASLHPAFPRRNVPKTGEGEVRAKYLVDKFRYRFDRNAFAPGMPIAEAIIEAWPDFDKAPLKTFVFETIGTEQGQAALRSSGGSRSGTSKGQATGRRTSGICVSRAGRL